MTRRTHTFLLLVGIMSATAAHAQETKPEGMSDDDWANFRLRFRQAPQPQPPLVVAPTPMTDFVPPTVDEYEEVETYPGTGTGPLASVMVRTADAAQWFRDGVTYRHAYGFVARVDGIALRQFDTRWMWCQRLVITETTGSPEVGRVLYARLFAPRGMWEEVVAE